MTDDAAAPRPTGTIHDLGYKRYAGARRAASTRWRVLMANQIATAWKGWWRYKSPLAYAIGTTLIAGAVMYIFSEKVVRDFAGNAATTLANATIPKSIEWYTRAAFIVSLTVGARVVAGDVQAGAFTFYFARSVRPRDYVLGKLAGMVVLMAAIFLAGPLLLSLARLGLSSSDSGGGDVALRAGIDAVFGQPPATDSLVAALPLVPKAIAMGLLGTLVFATVPLAFSSLIANARYASALWATYYLVFGWMVSTIGRHSKSSIGALDLATSLDAVAYELFDLRLFRGRAGHLDSTAALVSLCAHVVVALLIVSYRVRRLHGSGVGGAS